MQILSQEGHLHVQSGRQDGFGPWLARVMTSTADLQTALNIVTWPETKGKQCSAECSASIWLGDSRQQKLE